MRSGQELVPGRANGGYHGEREQEEREREKQGGCWKEARLTIRVGLRGEAGERVRHRIVLCVMCASILFPWPQITRRMFGEVHVS